MDRSAEGLLTPEVCAAAASVLAGEPVGDPSLKEGVEALLAALGDVDHGAVDNRQALLRVAGRFQRLFPILPPDSPNLVFVGAELLADGPETADGPVSLAGSAATFAQAFERCVGEGAEYLSQLATSADIVARGPPSRVEHGLEPEALSWMLAVLGDPAEEDMRRLGWVSGRCLGTMRPVLLPADLCLRRSGDAARTASPANPGSGCAAGPTVEAATVSALLETIERDAAALWWSGGRPARPLSLEVGAAAEAGSHMARLRGGVTSRRSRLLDITSDLGVPCIAAVSLDEHGRGFACGLAAGLDVGTAIRSAVEEMCQMELSHRVIALKRQQRGDGALNDHDLAHLERGRLVDAEWPSLQARGAPLDWQSGTAAPSSVDDVADRLAKAGCAAFATDCSRPDLAIPVVKVLAAGLQPYPSAVVTARLSRLGADDGPGPAVALL